VVIAPGEAVVTRSNVNVLTVMLDCRCPPACSTPVMFPAIGPLGGLAMPAMSVV
jgi:hypothetical protein